jgi:hypothetical protein
MFFLSKWRRGVCSVVVISSVMPVVSLDGLAVGAVGEGERVDSTDDAASLRARENSIMCVYSFLSMVSFSDLSSSETYDGETN